MSVHIVILAGGSGTRFWPASRASRPKQLLALGTQQPLIVETIERVMPLVEDWQHIYVASGVHVASPTRALLPQLPQENLLVEPIPRNTAPCIGWATATIRRRDPEAIVIVLPSDHYIQEREAYLESLKAAAQAARTGRITTLGVRPNRPETGFGYIELASSLPTVLSNTPTDVVRFVEKPDRPTAERFVREGRYLWNAGMFVFRAGDMIAEIQRHVPELADTLDAFDRAAAQGNEAQEVSRLFGHLPSVSIDYAIMEKVKNLAVIPIDVGWSDVGSFQASYELAAKDALGNAAPAGTLLRDAEGCLVIDMRTTPTAQRVVALVGVSHMAAVVTDDAVLLIPRDRADEAKKMVEELSAQGRQHLI